MLHVVRVWIVVGDVGVVLGAGGAEARRGDAVSDLMLADGPTTLLSSPDRRCVQLLAPLSERTGREVGISSALSADAGTPDVVGLIGAAADRTLLCTHRSVVAGLFAALSAAGVRDIRPTDERWSSRVVWEFDPDLLVMTPLFLPAADLRHAVGA